MDLQYSTESFGSADLSWLATTEHLGDAVGVTLVVATAVEATHYPDGYIKPGTLLAQYTGGANDGLWAPWFNDWSDGTNTGLDTVGGVALDGFRIRKDRDGTALATVVVGAMIPAKSPLQVSLGNMPASVDEDGTTAHAVVAGDLPAAWTNIDGF